MRIGWRHRFSVDILVALILILGSWLPMAKIAIAQIIPDDSLGAGRSRVRSNVPIRGERGDTRTSQETQRIDGGITRSTALFHSFEAFNVGANQRIYFANPRGIQSIFSRVTGNDPSDILGTLGVDGNADLFLLNPNGIIFGDNAQLDIRGSFLATTADAFTFEDGSQFSAVQPELPSLLTLNVTPGLQYGRNPGAIANRADLSVGRDLTLTASRIDHTGTLTAAFGDLNLVAIAGNLVLSDNSIVQADKNLMLYASGQVQVVDTVLSSGDELRIWGENAITLSNSDLSSGRDMVFRAPVRRLGVGLPNRSTDRTLFTTGGYFVTEAADGTVVDFLIPHEQVILARGDVRLDANYQGRSLYILAGGRITVADGVNRIAVDRAAENQITRNISDGVGGMQAVTIQSSAQPIFDGRSGINWADFPGLDIANTNSSTALVSFGNNDDPNHITNATLSLARINSENPISITNAGGLVYLSNRYYPNPNFSGNILVNSIDTSGFLEPISTTIESRNNIKIDGTINTSFLPQNTLSLLLGPNPTLDELRDLFAPSEAAALPNAGDVTLLANQSIQSRAGSTIESLGQQGGDITLSALQGNISLDDTVVVSVSIDTGSINTEDINTGSIDTGENGEFELRSMQGDRPPGDIFLAANSINIRPFSKVLNIALLGQNPAGNLTATATDRIRITNVDGTSVTELSSFPASVLTNQFDAFTESTGLATAALAEAEAGQVVVSSSQLFLRNNQAEMAPNLFGPERSTGILSASLVGSSGNAGDIFINSDTVLIRGNQPGTLVIPNTLDRAQLLARVLTGINLTARGTGLPGNLNLQTRQLTMADGAALISGIVGSVVEQTQAGSDRTLAINASDRITLDGKAVIATATLSRGRSGDLSINVSESGNGIFLTNGAVISADSTIFQDEIGDISLAGSAGNIDIYAPTITLMNNARIGAASVDNGGPTGAVSIITNRLEVDRSLISTSSENDVQTAGDIIIEAQESVQLRGELELDNRQGGILAEATQDGNAGQITVTTPQLVIEDGAAILTSTNVGIGGNIQLRSIDELWMRNGEISAQGEDGQAGNINIQANRMSLENSIISAATGENTSGAEIQMQGLNLLFMSGESLLSAQAGADADGGRIFIDAADGFVIGTADNNDIIARANEGQGGDINITAFDIFGLEARNPLTPFSDINASSNFGVDGAIAISSLDVNPLNGVLELPNTPVDVAQLVDQQLCRVTQGSTFVNTGQGGVQPSPHHPFRSEDLWEDWRLTAVPELERQPEFQLLPDSEVIDSLDSQNVVSPIREAQGWRRTTAGEVMLIAHVPDVIDALEPADVLPTRWHNASPRRLSPLTRC